MKTTPTSGARASAAGEECGRRLRPGRSAGLGRGAGPRENQAAGEGGKACGPKFKKGEGKMILSFSFSSIFQNPF